MREPIFDICSGGWNQNSKRLVNQEKLFYNDGMRKTRLLLFSQPRLAFLAVFLFFMITGCTEAPPPPPQEDLERKVRTLLELPTYEQNYREVIYLGEQASFLSIPTRDLRLLFSLDVTVEAGLDLRESFKVVPRGWQQLTITLPEPRILTLDADEESIQQYFIKEWGLGTGFGRLDLYDEINVAKERVRREAVERGILEKARENAETLLSQMFLMAGFESVQFRTAR